MVPRKNSTENFFLGLPCLLMSSLSFSVESKHWKTWAGEPQLVSSLPALAIDCPCPQDMYKMEAL